MVVTQLGRGHAEDRPPVSTSGRIRVLHILARDDFGGTETQMVTLLEKVDAAAFESVLAILDEPGPVTRRLKGSGIEVHALGNNLWVASLRLVRLLRRVSPHVVCASGIRAALVARLLARPFAPRARFVHGVRGATITATIDLSGMKARSALLLERAASRLVDVYDANSRGALELLASAGIDRSRLRYIPNGLDTSFWSPPESPAPKDGLVVCVSRLLAGKRLEDLVEAVARLQVDGHVVSLHLVGSGPMRGALQARVAERGLSDTVTFHGNLGPSDIRALLRTSTVFCLPSAGEGMPGSVMEAMACGLPVVATSVGGITALIEDGVSGSLVPVGDVDAIAAALSAILGDPVRAQEMGEAGRRKVQAEFSLQRLVEAKQNLYRSLVEQPD